MAAPNLANVANIYGTSTGAALTTTTTTSLLTNSAASGKVLKVNDIYVTNKTASSATTTIDVYNGTTGYYIAYTLTVPVGATVVVVDRNSYIYLLEGWSIRGGASANSTLDVVISYEDMS
jgi:uncharacterized protein YaaQ